MDRKEFISLLGIGAITALTASQLQSCSKDESVKIDFTLDLNATENSPLKNPGGFLIKSGIIIAYTLPGDYIAVSSRCTHQGTTVEFEPAMNRFHCPNHDSRFSANGSIINGPANSPLQSYSTELIENNLRIFQ